jgi:hypothetical protein
MKRACYTIKWRNCVMSNLSTRKFWVRGSSQGKDATWCYLTWHPLSPHATLLSARNDPIHASFLFTRLFEAFQMTSSSCVSYPPDDAWLAAYSSRRIRLTRKHVLNYRAKVSRGTRISEPSPCAAFWHISLIAVSSSFFSNLFVRSRMLVWGWDDDRGSMRWTGGGCA